MQIQCQTCQKKRDNHKVRLVRSWGDWNQPFQHICSRCIKKAGGMRFFEEHQFKTPKVSWRGATKPQGGTQCQTAR